MKLNTPLVMIPNKMLVDGGKPSGNAGETTNTSWDRDQLSDTCQEGDRMPRT
jgi:hypothetical protein